MLAYYLLMLIGFVMGLIFGKIMLAVENYIKSTMQVRKLSDAFFVAFSVLAAELCMIQAMSYMTHSLLGMPLFSRWAMFFGWIVTRFGTDSNIGKRMKEWGSNRYASLVASWRKSSVQRLGWSPMELKRSGTAQRDFTNENPIVKEYCAAQTALLSVAAEEPNVKVKVDQ